MEVGFPEKKTIIQHNAITSGRYDFSACQLDVLFILMATIDDKDSPEKEYDIHITDIEKITGRIWNYEQLREATGSMIARPYEVESDTYFDQLSLFRRVRYVKGEAIVRFLITNEARPFFFDLKKNFTVLELKSILSCSSKYAKRIYALACQWHSVGYFETTVKRLKQMLGLMDKNGNNEQFERISNFKEKVLDIAVTQINENTNIKTAYTMRKTGKSFDKLKFTVHKKVTKQGEQKEIDFTMTPEDQKALNDLMAYNINETIARQVIKLRKVKEAGNVIREIIKMIKEGKQVDNPSALFTDLMRRAGHLPVNF